MSFERLMPGTLEWDLYYANHASRYQFALTQLENKKSRYILDAATGVGFGAHLLGNNNIGKIIAIDRDKTTINFAEQKYKHEAITFVVDDCETFEQSKQYYPFDAVISFETLEHLPNPKLFIANCFECLLPGGQLIISTPNQLVSSPDGNLNWEFHEKEYTAAELVELLENNGFVDIKIYGQQFTAIGILRQQMRAELYRINSNPFNRLGKWIQHTFKRVSFSAVLPEQPEDFEIIEYTNLNDIVTKNTKGPFVLIAVCKKNSPILNY